MAPRPSFQFYPAEWRNNANLRRCSPAARGVWMDVMCVLHDSDEYGLVHWPLNELAAAAGAAMKLVKELVDKGVLKGCDRGDCRPYTYTPRSGRKDGPTVTLVASQPGPIWFSSRMVRDEYVRTIRGDKANISDDIGETPNTTPKPTIGVDIGPRTRAPSSSSSASLVPLPNGNGQHAAAQKPPKPVDPWKEVYDRGKEILGSHAGGIITNLRKTFDNKPRKVLAKLEDAAEKRNPVEWINAFLWEHGPPGIEVGSVSPLP